MARRTLVGVLTLGIMVGSAEGGDSQTPTRLPAVKSSVPAVKAPARLPKVNSTTTVASAEMAPAEMASAEMTSDHEVPSVAVVEDPPLQLFAAQAVDPPGATSLLSEVPQYKPARPVTGLDTQRFYQSLESLTQQAWPQHSRDLAASLNPLVENTLSGAEMPSDTLASAGRLNFPDPILRSHPNAGLDTPLFAGRSSLDPSVETEGDFSRDFSAHYADDFSPTPIPNASMIHDGQREQWAYDAKHDVATQYPLIQWGREWYGDGITPKGIDWFGPTNLVRPKFYMYGDYRTGVAGGRNAQGRTDNWASRLNLDLDLQLTDTDRFHGFVGPLDNNNQFTRWEKVGDDIKYRSEFDLTPVTGFYEGDLGVLMGASQSRTSPFELPFTIGLVPLLFQNGIWMEDAVTGAAFALPARHSRLLNWANYDATFFAVVDQLNSAAFGSDEHAAQAFGTAWFIDAYGGYIETGYAYVRDRNASERSYHNITASFTRRYLDRISNSVRVIVNSGQDLDKDQRTADGGLLLVENSWITAKPLTVVPYANFFYGWDRPQSVARAAGSGGILRNTGINFESDGLNGFATLDPTAADTAGGAVGVDLIADDFGHQWLLELAYVTPHGNGNPAVPDDQFAAGTRYQVPLSNATLLRFDVMYGWRGELTDVYGTRMEYRWKF
ncbi:hypothetical protein Pla52o_56250 [Novipirellula galeiformis]|uniref:Uncharacterized protein n=1 Tax=Novipirellula galeiformis TaxID=2528004 RepID=A0A5C6BHM1_9BACT|nr:hypothetical protein [Novipirellula galeiformis]TWU11187.1 hypothetical protein Pla52o_56250 [Novipirellula galeiformis]